jgi:hypothetical protein
MIAASNPGAAELAGRRGDAMINTEVEADLVRCFQSAGGDKPRFVEMTVWWAKDERRARKTAHDIWSLAGLEGMLFTRTLDAVSLRGGTQACDRGEDRCGHRVRPRAGAVRRRDKEG